MILRMMPRTPTASPQTLSLVFFVASHPISPAHPALPTHHPTRMTPTRPCFVYGQEDHGDVEGSGGEGDVGGDGEDSQAQLNHDSGSDDGQGHDDAEEGEEDGHRDTPSHEPGEEACIPQRVCACVRVCGGGGVCVCWLSRRVAFFFYFLLTLNT